MGTAAHIVLPPASDKSGWDLADAEADGWDDAHVMQHIKQYALCSYFKDIARNQYKITSNNAYQNSTNKQKIPAVIRIEKGPLASLLTPVRQFLPNAIYQTSSKFFQRGSQLVRLGTLQTSSQSFATACSQEKLVIMEAKKSFILDVLGRYGRFVKLDRRSGELRAADPPKDVADTIMGRAGLWPMPPLRGILTCPTLRPDGSLLLTPGYDPQSQYLFRSPASTSKSLASRHARKPQINLNLSKTYCQDSVLLNPWIAPLPWL